MVWRKNITKSLKAFNKNGKYRLNVIKELINTEKGYINDLTLIIDKVKKPLVEKQIINTPVLEKQVFSNLEEIVAFNSNNFY